MQHWLNEYIGIEFENKGRGETCDCWGLVRRVYSEQFGIEIPSFTEYDSADDIKEVARLIKGKESSRGETWIEVPVDEECFGDVAIFKIAGAPVHIGMVLGDNKMLHVEKGIDSCVENYKNMRWVRRLHKFYRHKDRS
jgi:cell wall-associated NlpC family hydrolase